MLISNFDSGLSWLEQLKLQCDTKTKKKKKKLISILATAIIREVIGFGFVA